jgi:hypothetical protein
MGTNLHPYALTEKSVIISYIKAAASAIQALAAFCLNLFSRSICCPFAGSAPPQVFPLHFKCKNNKINYM